ncbi:hypothetical protein BGW38_000899 [Lunasporangiospora selenospora]|uniref:phosphatidylserine decarboxylase n=1 Tax=Lunasporangiospora selenospora TaxID=979761 RepID=A0A9P6FWC3_9FUNG|nr:hypothetical protein BGW38_000899 [Lunasporangiospora selenospora]
MANERTSQLDAIAGGNKTLDEHVQDISHALKSSVSQSSPLAESGQLFDGGVLTSSNESCFKALYHAIMPTNWIHEESKEYRFGNYVVNRKTSETMWEDMPLYTRIGMHLLFACMVDRQLLHTHRLQHLFAEESIRQGLHFDAPESTAQIPHFIKTYSLDTSDLLEQDLSKYRSFNEFFYRKLKADARPIHEKDNPNVIVSAADCRLTAFESITSATEIWIKGKSFTLDRLLQDDELVQTFTGGAIAIFRLAPQDYHRFHSPVRGKVLRDPKKIDGTYFTVNPMAVNEDLDVFTENVRMISVLELDQPQEGDNQEGLGHQCVFVSIGALLVGSIELTGAKEKGNRVEKGDELGYFAYGGSTCVLLFQKDSVQFDEDLIQSSKAKLETLVQMGEQIGVFL